jgi:hypothetical protein
VNPEEQLRARPSFEQATADYLAMLDQMRTAISGIVPTLHWKTARSFQDGSAFCGEPFTDVPGTSTAAYDAGVGEGGIPDADWPRVEQAVIEIAKKHGFTTVTPLVSKTGDHVLDIHGPWGARLELGSEVNTVLGIFGACFLHENARNGSPTPSESNPFT